MKTKTIKHFLTLILLCLVFPVQFLYAEVQLTVSNIASSRGNVMIAVYKSQKDFDEKTAHKTLAIPVNSNEAEVSILDLEPGWYMIAVYVDKNQNSKMDRFIVMPVEQYGFSNNARGFMGPASFRNARFYYDGKNSQLTIRL